MSFIRREQHPDQISLTIITKNDSSSSVSSRLHSPEIMDSSASTSTRRKNKYQIFNHSSDYIASPQEENAKGIPPGMGGSGETEGGYDQGWTEENDHEDHEESGETQGLLVS
jgi:hypothetical protein